LTQIKAADPHGASVMAVNLEHSHGPSVFPRRHRHRLRAVRHRARLCGPDRGAARWRASGRI